MTSVGNSIYAIKLHRRVYEGKNIFFHSIFMCFFESKPRTRDMCVCLSIRRGFTTTRREDRSNSVEKLWLFKVFALFISLYSWKDIKPHKNAILIHLFSSSLPFHAPAIPLDAPLCYFTHILVCGGVEPLELSYLLGITVGCLAAFLILFCWCIYAIRAKKCCFRSKYHNSIFMRCLFSLLQRLKWTEFNEKEIKFSFTFFYLTDRSNYKTAEKDR